MVLLDLLVQAVPGVRLKHLVEQGNVYVGVVVGAAAAEPHPQGAGVRVVANAGDVARRNRMYLHDVLLGALRGRSFAAACRPS